MFFMFCFIVIDGKTLDLGHILRSYPKVVERFSPGSEVYPYKKHQPMMVLAGQTIILSQAVG